MAIHIKNLKVRPKKSKPTTPLLQIVLAQTNIRFVDAINVMCAPQLTSLLGCWAASNDLHSINACRDAAQDLFHCMKTTVCYTRSPHFSLHSYLYVCTANA